VGKNFKNIGWFGILFAVMGLLFLGLFTMSCGSGGYGSSGGGTDAPGAFSLTSPSPNDGASGVGTTPTFAWTASANALDYRVQVDTTGLFFNPVVNTTVGATTYSYTVTSGKLTMSTMYYWRIIAENAYGEAIAGPQTFTP